MFRLVYHVLALLVFCILVVLLLPFALVGWTDPVVWALLHRTYHDEQAADALDRL